MNLVCREDIYKLNRRRRDVAADKDPEMTDLFLKPEAALGVLTGKLSKRRVTQHNIRTRSIIDECCDTEVGCSWEDKLVIRTRALLVVLVQGYFETTDTLMIAQST
ncbi:hypothetical protein IscW_ISCW002549 [Ixodes scapularis]|uniref:Uncharacterized protein n=1 Tax=Ixodes scapularis TaxID=6945 RepID=B7PD14_IXOSC|nr:hypothetical protein IscW_ISCW002549 [Ixodes scapularis]|eukprot:XP_002410559.1 hypothetical protein IscW_ISCW002549 [Ixodes scapularis]